MFSWFRRLTQRSSPAAAPQAHITFGATSVGRSLSRTRLLLSKQLWIWPIIAIVLLAAVGYGIRTAIERTMKENLRSELATLVNVERSMLETWLRVQESNAASLANDQDVRNAAAGILRAAESANAEAAEPAIDGATAAPNELPALRARLAQELAPGLASHQFASFFLADRQRRIVAASQTELLSQIIPEYQATLTRALDGHATVSPPYPSIGIVKDESGKARTGVPTMFVTVPVRDDDFQVVAALALRIRPERDFTRLLQLGRIGKTGETYAIDKNGLLVSGSRFDEELILLGLLPDTPEATSILNIHVRDPGGDLTKGFRPKVRRAELPLTKNAAAAISGGTGVLMDGHNDYRGVPTVSAYTWLPNYDMGLITKLDYAEAFRPLSILRWAFFSLMGLLVLSSAAIFVFTIVVARLQREAQKAVIEAKHLGQYRLEGKLGSGAMGVIYKGHHAMLRRPTAIKMLNVERVSEGSMKCFEREVQITCKLNNPNTVAIYDYGRTPEGVFYYAMEYLDGIDLQALVDRYGPQPEGRVINILKQICGSLYEAHSLGLVHRDIKPANVMLNRRGGEPDVVKVLDFGLVKALDDAKQARQVGGLSGTPLYMSPEAIQTPDLVDARSDLYAVGAIGYFLITGQPVFQATALAELCQKHVEDLPDAPSKRLGRAISAELESAILACLEKSRAKRPQTARDLAALLDRSPTANSWTLDDAEAWWGRHERMVAGARDVPQADVAQGDGTGGPAARTTPSGFDQTIAPQNETGS